MTKLRLIAFAAVALAVATSAQAMSPVPLHQSDGLITQVRSNCGAGMRWNKHSVVARLRPPAAMSGAAWSQATKKQEARPGAVLSGFSSSRLLTNPALKESDP